MPKREGKREVEQEITDSKDRREPASWAIHLEGLAAEIGVELANPPDRSKELTNEAGAKTFFEQRVGAAAGNLIVHSLLERTVDTKTVEAIRDGLCSTFDAEIRRLENYLKVASPLSELMVKVGEKDLRERLQRLKELRKLLFGEPNSTESKNPTE